MALVPDQKLSRKTFSVERRPLMLKDYLLDDLSSCSSNGFKSFPRRQCCTTIRFLLEIDLKTRDSNTTSKRLLQKSRSKAASTTISALQRASEAVLNAVKLLPFTSVKSLSPSPSVQRKARKAFLPRSFSRKLLKRSFWRKADHPHEYKQVEEKRTIDTNTTKPLKLFADFLGEQHQPSDQNTSSTPNRVSSSCSSKSNSNSWTESDFTETTLQSSSSNFETSSENDTVEAPKHVVQQSSSSSSSSSVSNQVGGSAGEDSINCSEDNTTKDWGNDQEEKEQCSPVSVLDCPFEDDETDITSPFHQRLARMEGTKQKLMQKLRRFESLARLEPVDLEKRMATLELEDGGDSVETPIQSNKEDETEKKAKGLLKQIKSTTPCDNISLSKADNLLLEFFREMIGGNQNDKNMLKAAEDWIYGKSLEQVFVGWDVEGGRKSYLRDMETNGRWRNFVNEEKQELASAIEIQVFTSLVNELVIDII